MDLQSTPDLSKKVEAIKEVLDMCNLPASNLNIQSWVSFNFSTPPAFTSLSLWFEVNSEVEMLPMSPFLCSNFHRFDSRTGFLDMNLSHL